MRCLALFAATLLGACAEPPPDPPQAPGASPAADYLHGADWPSYNRDLAGTRFSPLTAINRTNVDELRQAWSYALGSGGGEARPSSELTPLVVDGVLYATAADRIVALRAHTGEEVWRHAVEQGTPSRRGLSFWPGDATAPARVFFTVGHRLVAVEAATGLKASGFGTGGEVEMTVTYAGAPTRFEDLLIVGSSGAPGGVRAFDARTGAERWVFAPEGAPLHSAYSVTVDVDSALLFAVLAGPEGDAFYSGARTGERAIENAVVALDARTGRRRWHFQVVRNDLWDYDLMAPPALLDATVGRRRVPVLALAAPTGYLYVLDRVTGEPVLGLVETPVPGSDVPGEQSAPAQPIPAAPPPLARVSYAAADVVTARDTTAEHATFCRALRDRSGGLQSSGPFTPFRYRPAGAEARSTIVFPGSLGAATWGGVAADPSRGIVFVNTNSEGAIGWIEPNTGGDVLAAQTGEVRNERLPYRRTSVVGGPFARFWWRDAAADSAGNEQTGDSAAWPCQKPPWGQLAAVDVATGAVVWQVPLGITTELPEGRKRTGRLNIGGATATAAGLVFIGATNDRRFRAFDSRTGEELWVTELPLSAHSVPIVYAGDDGKQYVAIVAAGGSPIDDAGAADAQSIIAYALP